MDCSRNHTGSSDGEHERAAHLAASNMRCAARAGSSGGVCATSTRSSPQAASGPGGYDR